MSYQVIARKYRPQRFVEVLGQEHITRTLQNAIDASRLHHAYLFTGVRGVGKTTVARILAKALNCETAPTNEPCNKCTNCADITVGNNLDVQEIDGASNTGVDDVREIRERIKFLPSQGKYKIYIIDEVHMLSTAAFNALLKTLEEPPAHVIFVFATTEPQKIPATILSRCQRYDFRRMSVPLLVDSIKKIADTENVKAEPDALVAIAGEAEGSMRDAQSLFDQAVAFSGGSVTYESLKDMLGFMDQSDIKELLTAIATKNSAGALTVVDRVFERGGDLARLSQELLSWVRSLLVFKSTNDQAFLKDILSENREFISKLAADIDSSSLEQMFRICLRGAEEVARSRYPKMVIEAMCIGLTEVRPVRSVDSLIERLKAVLSRPQPSDLKPQAHAGQDVRSEISSQAPTSEVKKKEIPNPVKMGAIDEASWQKYVKWLRSDTPQLFSILEHGIFVGGTETSVRLQYTGGSLYAEMLNDAHRKKQMEDSMEKFLGKHYLIDVKMIGNEFTAKTQKLEKREEDKVRAKRIKEETLENPTIKEAAKILGADIKEINIKE